MIYRAFQLAIHPEKCTFPVGASMPHVIHVICIHLSQRPKPHLGSAVFAQLTTESLYTLHCVLKHD